MIQSVVLPVVNGGTGAPAATDTLAGAKTLVATGVSGTIFVEASGDGVRFVQVATLTASQSERVLTVVCKSMRVKATAGSANSVQVMAEEAATKAGVIPNPPTNGPGASLDVSEFGFLSSIFVAGVTGKGSISLEVSGDNVHWTSALLSCTSPTLLNGGLLTAKFIRARGQGCSAASIVVCSDNTLSEALGDIQQGVFVWQPGGVQHDNVYPDWNEVYALVSAFDRSLGVPKIVVDGTLSGQFTLFGDPMAVIPAGTWDLSQVTIQGIDTPLWQALSFADGCNITIGTNHYPAAYPYPIGIVFDGKRLLIVQSSTVTSPFGDLDQGVIVFTGTCHVFSGILSKPLFKSAGYSGISSVGQDVSFNAPYFNFPGSPYGTGSPLFDLAGNAMFAENPNFDAGVMADSVGGGYWEYFPKTQQCMTGLLGGFEWADLGLPPSSTVVRYVNSRPQPGVSAVATGVVSAASGHVTPVDATAPVTVNLPSALFSFGEQVWVKKTAGAAAITIHPMAGQTIDGAAGDKTLTADVLWLVSDGAGNWLLMQGTLI
jgi:hypothetical protein